MIVSATCLGRCALRVAALLSVVALAAPESPGQEASPAAEAPAEGAAAPADQTASSPVELLGGGAVTGHGWALQAREALAPNGTAEGANLVHLPPRLGEGGADFGTVRLAMTFPQAPAYAAGFGGSVYLVFGAEGADKGAGGEERSRRVLKLEATSAGAPGAWRLEPPGRAESLPSLPTAGTLADVSASSVGPVAVIRNGDHAAEGSTWSVLVLWRNAWRRFEGPWMGGGAGPNAMGDRVMVAGGSGAVAMGWLKSGFGSAAAAGGQRFIVWEGRLGVGRGEEPEAGQRTRAPERLVVDWAQREVELGALGELGELSPVDLAWIDGVMVLLARRSDDGREASGADGGELVVLDVTRDVGVVIAEIDEPGWSGPIVPMHGDGRFALLKPAGAAGEDGAASVGAASVGAGDILEMSTTGRVWYMGPQERQGPLSLRDVRALAFMLGALAILVVLFVFRPESTPVVTLPKGAALASGWRRSAAAAVDLLVALVLASLLLGDGAFGLLSMLLAGERSGGGAAASGHVLTGLMLAQAMGIVYGSLGEALSGRTVGKAMFGCIVLSSRAKPGRVDARAAILRNVVKWGLPMLLVFLFWDPMRRHPGDLLGGTVVVEPVDGDEGE